MTMAKSPGTDAEMREALKARMEVALDGQTRFSRDCSLSGAYLCSLVWPMVAATLSPPTGSAGDDETVVREADRGRQTADVGVFGPIDGMGNLDRSGSYIGLSIASKSSAYGFRISMGAAEVLLAELAGLLDALTPQPPKAETPADGAFNPADHFKPGSKALSPGGCDDCGLNYCHCIKDPEPKAETPAGADQGEPVVWVIPGGDTANCDGFVDAMCFQHGEFTRPLYAALSLAPAARAGDGVERVRHLKRGTEYDVLGEAKGFQSDEYGEEHPHTLIVYRRVGGGRLLWMLPSYFRDGRFVTLTAAPAANGEGA